MQTIHDTLRQWVLDYTGEMRSWAVYRVNDAALAEDLVQETFLAAFRAYASFQHRSSAKTWLFSILNRKIYDHYRSIYRDAAAAEKEEKVLLTTLFDDGHWRDETAPKTWEADGEATNLLDDAEFQQILAECMARLPQKWRVAMESKYLTDKDSPAICQELAISTTNFWQMLHRAKLQLRQCLERNWFLEL